MAPNQPDPKPWKHVDAARVSDPHAEGVPMGGYTFLPRSGYSNHEDRYVSTRSQEGAQELEATP